MIAVQSARMRERKRPAHRPSFGVAEATYLIRAPEALLEAMRKEAARQGITASEAWRRAAHLWLKIPPSDYTKYLNEKEDK